MPSFSPTKYQVLFWRLNVCQVQGLFPETLNLQWQIQDFWDSNPRGGANLLFAILFAKNCVKMKKVDGKGGAHPQIRHWSTRPPLMVIFSWPTFTGSRECQTQSPLFREKFKWNVKRQTSRTHNELYCCTDLLGLICNKHRRSNCYWSEDIYLRWFFLDICLFSRSLLQWVCIL